MDLIKEALSMGFADAAIMDTKDLVFVPEYRQFCEDNFSVFHITKNVIIVKDKNK